MKKKTELKKLFISCPTEGRKLEDIKNTRARMQKIAEAIFDQELDVINGYPLDVLTSIEDNKLITYNFGVAATQLAQADYFIGIHQSIYFEDCQEEFRIAEACKIPTTQVSVYDIAPDAVDIAAKEMVETTFTVEPLFVRNLEVTPIVIHKP